MNTPQKGLIQILTDVDNREIKEHGSFSFPVMVSHEILSNYQRGSFFWHWHPEAELTLILEGDISYRVNEQTFHLKSGDGLFCNSNMPHTGSKLTSEDCIYMSVTFDPKIIYGFESSLLQTRYVAPLTLNRQLDAVTFHPGTDWQEELLHKLHDIWHLKQTSDALFEFRVQILLSQIWLLIYQHSAPAADPYPGLVRERERILIILSYLHSHYPEKITLEEVAAQVNICPGECCRLFKKSMKQSIFEYLLQFRIEKSLSLLENSNKTITDISAETGFSNPCYFTKVFRGKIKCSPSEYRKRVCRIEHPESVM